MENPSILQPDEDLKEQNKKKWFSSNYFYLVLAIILAGLLLTYTITLKKFLNEVFPFINPDTQLYLEVSNPSSNSEDLLIAEHILGGVSFNQNIDIQLLAEKTSPDKIIFITENNEQYIIIQNNRDLNEVEILNLVETEDDYFSVISKVTKLNNDFIIIGDIAYEDTYIPWSTQLLKTKKSLVDIQEKSLLVLINNPYIKNLIGYTSSEDYKKLFLSSNNFIEPSFEQNKISPDSYFHLKTISIENSPLVKLLSNNNSNWKLSQLVFPGEYTLYSEDENIFEDIYKEDSKWSLRINLNKKELAHQAILEDLSKEFPQSSRVELPDGSTIFEINRNKDAFTLDSEEREFIFTFPNGQILSNDLSGTKEVLFRKGNLDGFSSKTVENLCVISNFSGYGHYTPGELGQTMWKSVFFSYNKHNMVMCFID